MKSLKLYCKGPAHEALLAPLRVIVVGRQIPFEVADLSTHGEYDPAKERAVYEGDFKPCAKALKRATGVSITQLRSNSGNYFVSTPETLAVLNDDRVVWWCHGKEAIRNTLGDILSSGRLPA